jgi:cytoskeletal protein CcmA (bactofilin family)
MFSKSKDAAAPAANINSLPVMPAPKRTPRGTAPSIISADLTVTGTLVSNGDIQIDGVVQGDVRSVGLVIGDKAEINGEVLAEDITVRGKVTGRIRARKVLLAATSHVEGDILHEAFAVESGAFFEGNCRHSDNPLDDNAMAEENRKPVQRAVAAPVVSPQPAAPATPGALFAPLSPATT